MDASRASPLALVDRNEQRTGERKQTIKNATSIKCIETQTPTFFKWKDRRGTN